MGSRGLEAGDPVASSRGLAPDSRPVLVCALYAGGLPPGGDAAADGESDVSFIPGICSRCAICPVQQAHVFLLVLPSLLLARTARGGGHRELGLVRREAGLGSPSLGSHIPSPGRSLFRMPVRFFPDPAIQMARMMQGVCPSQQIEEAWRRSFLRR